jgi:hypothetical protein
MKRLIELWKQDVKWDSLSRTQQSYYIKFGIGVSLSALMLALEAWFFFLVAGVYSLYQYIILSSND